LSELRTFFRAGAVEILRFLDEKGEVRHNEILKQDFVRSRETFSRRLHELGKLNLIKRSVLDTKPPGVTYSLTKKGKKAKELLDQLESVLK
jgi:DNA-binding HxlR family transcriptional regulator